MKNTSSSLSAVSAFAVILLAVSVLGGCSRSDAMSHEASSASSLKATGGEVGVSALAPAGRALITTIAMSVTVENVDDASARLRTAVEKAGGFVADSRTGGAEGQVSAQLELRVPAQNARSLHTTASELGSVTSSTEKVEDVTEQRADLDARLRNARTQEKRLLELMSSLPSSIHDIVEAEKELARVRENVERLEAQELGMKSKTDLATVHVTLTTKSVAAWKTPGKSIVTAGKQGIEAAEAISVCLAMATAAVGPTILPILALLGAIVVIVRRRRAKMMSAMVG